LMKMNLYSMSAVGFIVTFFAFLVAFVICIIIGLFGPKVLSTLTPEPATGLSQEGSVWTATVQGLSKLNQQFLLTSTIDNDENQLHGIDKQVEFNISMSGRHGTNQNWEPIVSKTHKHHVVCYENKTSCNTVLLVHEPYINYYGYQFNVSILSPDTFIGNVTFTFSYMNDDFTLFELWFRFVFLIITFAMIVSFAIKLRGFSWRDWTLEQKWISVLLFGLLAFNNPFFPIEILVDGWVPPFLDIIFTVTFIFLVLLFILVIVDGVKLEEREREFKSFYLPKMLLLGLLWIAVVGVFSWQEYNELFDPTIAIEQTTVIIGFEIAMVILVLSYFFWLAYATIRACGLDSKKAFLKRRLRFFLFFSAIVILIIAFGILFEVYQRPDNAAEFLAFHSLCNLYIYVLAIVYLPSKESQRSGYTRNLQITTLEEDEDLSLEGSTKKIETKLDDDEELELESLSDDSPLDQKNKS